MVRTICATSIINSLGSWIRKDITKNCFSYSELRVRACNQNTVLLNSML